MPRNLSFFELNQEGFLASLGMTAVVEDDAKPWSAKGTTGVAVRTLVDLAMKFGANRSSVK